MPRFVYLALAEGHCHSFYLLAVENTAAVHFSCISLFFWTYALISLEFI